MIKNLRERTSTRAKDMGRKVADLAMEQGEKHGKSFVGEIGKSIMFNAKR